MTPPPEWWVSALLKSGRERLGWSRGPGARLVAAVGLCVTWRASSSTRAVSSQAAASLNTRILSSYFRYSLLELCLAPASAIFCFTDQKQLMERLKYFFSELELSQSTVNRKFSHSSLNWPEIDLDHQV